MLGIDLLASEITVRYGTIQRARGCFLYTRKGVRLTDLYQENGRAVLGWGGCSAFTHLKNVLSRGLTGSFDTDYQHHISKAVSSLLSSDRAARLYTSKERAFQVALSLFPDDTSFWRPWTPESCNCKSAKAVVMAPPFPWAQSLYIVAVRTDALNHMQDIPESERMPAPIIEAAARSLYDLKNELSIREEKNWFIYDPVLTKYWIRKGPYLYPKIVSEQYWPFLLHCLDCGLVINPSFTDPSIVPYGADKGVFSKLKNLPFKIDQ